MAHNPVGGLGAGMGSPRGTQERYGRWTQAKAGTGAQMGMLTKGSLKGTKHRNRVKRVK